MTSIKGTRVVLVEQLMVAKGSIWTVAVTATVLTLAVGFLVGVAQEVFSFSAPSTSGMSANARSTAVATGSSEPERSDAGLGLAAISQAAAENKYLFAFFWRDNAEQTAAMRQVFERATAKIADRARTVSVRITDPAESGIVKRYNLAGAPMPLVFAIAPNGAVTAGFPTKFEEQDLLGAFATPNMERCMKALQDGKLVVLSIQNESTKSNQAALRGVNDFQTDAQYANVTENLMVDPRDPAEAAFLNNLQIDPQTNTAVTAFLVPPSSVIAKYEGATTKEQLVADLQKSKEGDSSEQPVATTTSQPAKSDAGEAWAAMSRAAAEDKYLFAFFWSTDDEQTEAMRQVFENATAKIADRAMSVSVRITDRAESAIVKRYNLAGAPMPLVFAIAPNGAVTDGFPTNFEEQDLLDAFATPSMERSMKALQDGKLVLLSVQSESTKSNQAALRGVLDFQADARYANATETLMLDPRDTAEAPFLNNLQIDPQTSTAVTAFLVPPSSVIAKYEGATTKEQLVTDLQKAKKNDGPR